MLPSAQAGYKMLQFISVWDKSVNVFVKNGGRLYVPLFPHIFLSGIPNNVSLSGYKWEISHRLSGF